MYQRQEQGFGHGGGTAALTLDQAISFGCAGLAPASATRAGWRARLRERRERLDLVVDLGARIGSRQWWRGLATCAALCGGAIALWPGMPALDGPTPAPFAPAQYDEARALGISPLAYGADTGKRMAATDAVEPLVDTPERPKIDLTATLGIGDGFARVLARAGVADGEARRVAALVAGAQPLAGIAPGTRIALTLGRRANRSVARPLERLDFRARLDLALSVIRVGGAVRLEPHPIAVDDTPLRIQGVAGESLYRAARAAGAPASAVATYLKALGTRLSIGGIAGSDRFDIIVAHRRAATGETETGALLFAGLTHGARKTQLLRWTIGGREQWYEASGVGERRGGMTRPVAGRETSGFGMRYHPILGFSRFHKGVDFAAPYGSPIVAAADGRVKFAGWHGGHGNYVLLDHGGGIWTGYAHMSRMVAGAGAAIHQGQVIGYVGSTGLSTGPHLHYEVWQNGVAINPLTFAFSSTAQLAGAELARFRATLARLMAVHAGGHADAPVALRTAAVPARPGRS